MINRVTFVVLSPNVPGKTGNRNPMIDLDSSELGSGNEAGVRRSILATKHYSLRPLIQINVNIAVCAYPIKGELTQGGCRMLRIVATGVTALFIAGSQLAYAQVRELERVTAADVDALTDARVNVVKAALQLTPDQEKLWPAIEDAIRARAKDRKARLENLEKEAGELRGHSVFEILLDRSPTDFLNRRADTLTERAAHLKKLADAWRPLYQTLTPDQRRRLAHVEMIALRDMRRAVEHRRLRSEDDEEE